MDPTVAAALIGVAGSLGVAVYQNKQKRNAERQKNDALRAKADTEKAFERIGTAPTGLATIAAAYTIDKWEIASSFADDGAGERTKTWRGVRVTQKIQDLTVPHESKTTAPFELTDPTVEALPGSQAPVTLIKDSVSRHTVAGEHLSLGKVRIAGLLDPESSPISFNVRQSFAGVFCMTKEEAEEKYANDRWKLDYQAATIVVPTDTLGIRVTFPKRFAAMSPQPSAVVFFGNSEIVNDAETKRVNDAGVSFVGGVASLKIDKPLVGLAYAITWMPPAADAD